MAKQSHPLVAYINSLDQDAREDFAKRCETSVNYLRKAISAEQNIASDTAILIEIHSGGKVRVEQIRPDIDWAFLRANRRKSKQQDAA